MSDCGHSGAKTNVGTRHYYKYGPHPCARRSCLEMGFLVPRLRSAVVSVCMCVREGGLSSHSSQYEHVSMQDGMRCAASPKIIPLAL